MRRLAERLRKFTSALTARLGGTASATFGFGLLLISASAFTVSIGLGLLVSGLLLAGGSIAYERGAERGGKS